MGTVLLAGGVAGSSLGIVLFNFLSGLGQIDLVVQLSYVVFLGRVGRLMLQESLRAILRDRRAVPSVKRNQHGWVHALPFKVKFRTSGLYISVVPPFLVGLFVGLLGAIMGVGGGFILVPAMIYLLGMPTKVVVGTSLFQIIFVAGFTTFMHAATNQSVDIFLALFLILGGVIGAQIGTRVGGRLNGAQLRILLAIVVLAVCLKIALDLLIEPSDLYTLGGGPR
jgi:uncharacterized protein